MIEVALCGFTEMEDRLFEGIFRVSEKRQKSYRRWSDETGNPPAIYLVKQGKSSALELWKSYTDHYGNAAPTIQVGTRETIGWGELNELAGREVPCLTKPISAVKMLDTLDGLNLAPPPEVDRGMLIDDSVELDELMAMDRDTQRVGGGEIDALTRGKRTLVVDDSASLRLQLDISLGKKHGMRVDFAADGATALKKLASRKYDIVFLDVMLPDMDGFEICKKIRREFRSKVPVVMLTSRDGRRDQLKGVMVEADSYLIKPVSTDQLERTLAEHLKAD